jgi:RNA polymerase sigma-70 factor (ECF subfamily)
MRVFGRDTRARPNYDRLGDEELMPLVAGADAQAFRAILERHGDAAFSLAYRVCGTRQLAEDVTQEALLSLWRTASRYDPRRGSVRSWALRIVHNRAVDTLRAAGRQPPRASAAHDDSPAYLELEAPQRTDAQAIARVQRSGIQAALRELPEEQRQAIELAYYGGFSQSEIAAMLGEPLGTIKGRMRLGLHKLRDLSHTWETAT